MIRMFDVPKEAALVSGSADGPSELVAFDNSLRKAGIAEVNLFQVSSIWPADCKIVKMPRLEAGTIVPVILARVTSSIPGQKIAAALGIAISGNSHGMVSEYHEFGVAQKTAAENVESMVKYMMERRGLIASKVTSVSAGHIVQGHGAAVVAVVFVR